MNKKALCFGLEPYPIPGYTVDHCPLIEIIPASSSSLRLCAFAFFALKTLASFSRSMFLGKSKLDVSTQRTERRKDAKKGWCTLLPQKVKKDFYLLFTSKTAVDLCPLINLPVIAIGKGTAARAREKGFQVIQVAEEECQEGICDLLDKLKPASLFWPRSDRARPILRNYCDEKGIELVDPPVYSISFRKVELPPLQPYEALFFTSPSTVEAFFALNPQLPPTLELISIGKVTEKYLIGALEERGLNNKKWVFIV